MKSSDYTLERAMTEAEMVGKWIDVCGVTKSDRPNQVMNSYGLKGIVERFFGKYISNDTLVEVMVARGFKTKSIHGSRFVSFYAKIPAHVFKEQFCYRDGKLVERVVDKDF
jgi:hypothetical protein